MVLGPVYVRPDAIDPELRRFLAAIRAVLPGAYLVGGGVRDLLSGRRPEDLDLLAGGDAHAAAESLAERLGGSVFALDEGRGQYRVVVEGAPVRDIDVSTVEDGVEADLGRRDFTINAMAAPIEADGGLGEVIDRFGGVSDLESRLVRLVSEQALHDDPLRLLRAVRIAVELEFEVEDGTAESVRRLAGLVTTAAAERQRDELARMLSTSRAAQGLRLMDSLGLLAELVPELMAARGVEQPAVHYWDVFDHSIETVAALDAMLSQAEPADEAQRWLRVHFQVGLAWFPLYGYLLERTGGESRLVLLKLAALLHDVAKPQTKTVEADGRVRFFGHPELGAEVALAICERLRFGNRESRFVARLVKEHLRPTQLSGPSAWPSKRAVYRFVRDLSEAAPACLILTLADGASAAGPRLTPERWQGHVAYVSYVLEVIEMMNRPSEQQPRVITGHDLMSELALAPGPTVGRLLEAIEEEVADGDIGTRDEALAYARALLAERQGTAEEARG